MLTEFTTSNALAVKLWHEKLYRDARKDAYFERFMGESSDSLVQVKADLEKERGDELTFGIRMRLSGAGVTGDNVLEGNEESLVTYDFSLTLDQTRHAVRSKGKMSDKRVLFSVPNESRDALKTWISEKIDQRCFDAVGGSPTKIFYGGDATTTATIEAVDLLTLDMITKVKTWAMTGGNRTQTPLRPIMIKGKRYFVMLVHPDSAYDLLVSANWQAAQREARERSADNPIFQGALGVWSGVIIHEHESVPIVTNWGAGGNIAGTKNVFMGAQALCWAWGQRVNTVEESFDYQNQRGHAIGMIHAVGKPVFNAKDYGSVAVYTSRTQISDAA